MQTPSEMNGQTNRGYPSSIPPYINYGYQNQSLQQQDPTKQFQNVPFYPNQNQFPPYPYYVAPNQIQQNRAHPQSQITQKPNNPEIGYNNQFHSFPPQMNQGYLPNEMNRYFPSPQFQNPQQQNAYFQPNPVMQASHPSYMIHQQQSPIQPKTSPNPMQYQQMGFPNNMYNPIQNFNNSSKMPSWNAPQNEFFYQQNQQKMQRAHLIENIEADPRKQNAFPENLLFKDTLSDKPEENNPSFEDFDQDQKSRMLILTNLKDNVTEDELKNYFSDICETQGIHFLKSRNLKTFAVISFNSKTGFNSMFAQDSSQNYVHRFSAELLHRLINDDNDIQVQQSVKRLENPANFSSLLCKTNGVLEYFHKIISKRSLSFYANSVRVREIWIGNLPKDSNEESVKNTLSIFGKIDSIDLFFKEQVFAFVKFETSESATYCVDSSNVLTGKFSNVKVSYSDFLKRFNIVGNVSSIEENPKKLTSIVFLGVMNGLELPKEKFIREKFSDFGKIINMLSKPSPNDLLRSFMLVEMESKDQARKIKKFFATEDKDGRRRAKLGDKRYEVSILVKPNVTGNLEEYILPYLNIEQSQTNGMSASTNAVGGEMLKLLNEVNPQSEPVWIGFLTKMGKSLVGVEAYLIEGNFQDLLQESVFNLNITHKADFSEIANCNFDGIVRFAASNETHSGPFNDLLTYLLEKKSCGLIKHLSKYNLYIVPFFKGLLKDDQIFKSSDLIGIFVKNEESKTEPNQID